MFLFTRILFFSLFFLAAASAAVAFSDEQALKISRSAYWLRLLHYRDGRSEADGADFFMSPIGKADPKAELLANLAAFSDPHARGVGPLNQPPQCAFPERYRFLKSELALQSEDHSCKEFSEWKTRLHARSIVVVYAAAYMGSPGSMFGHTFLRIDSEPRGHSSPKNDLLDYAISFDAVTEADPGPEYIFKGLFGLYPGYFNINPYYLKTNNYTDIDSRDLWEYQLNLTPDQIDHLLNHIWEMGTTYFKYYFFIRNCSYHLLSLLEVANPIWELRSQFHASAIPIDTVKALTSLPDAVRSVQVRPSLLRVISTRISQMSSEERARFYTLRDDISQASSHDSSKTLDALMDWQKFKALAQTKSADEAQSQMDRKLLLLRAQNLTSDSIIIEKMVSPDHGHGSAKLALLAGAEGADNFVGIEARPAFQDLLGPDLGYLPQSELVLARLRASTVVSNRSISRIDEFTFAEVANLEAFSGLQKKLSWWVASGLQRPIDLKCVGCLDAYLQGGVGVTFLIQKMNWSFLATGHAEYSSAFEGTMDRFYRMGPGFQASLLWPLSNNWKVRTRGEVIQYLAGTKSLSLIKSELSVSHFVGPYDIRGEWSSYQTILTQVQIVDINLGWYF